MFLYFVFNLFSLFNPKRVIMEWIISRNSYFS